MKKRLLHVLLTGLAAAAVAFALHVTGALGRIEGATWAWRVGAFAPREAPSPRVQTILVDQPSLDWGAKEMGWSWPWPREVYTLFLKFCNRGGAKGVAFDILYTEPSSYGVDDDRALGAAIRATPNFVAGAMYKDGKAAPPPIPEVATNAAYVADVAGAPDADGVFRRAALARGGVRTLGYALLCGGGKGGHDMSCPYDAARGGRSGDGGKGGHDMSCPSSPLLLRFFGTNGMHRAWSAAAIIQSEMNLESGAKATVDPAVFSNAYVFVGFSAAGLKDLRPTPVNRTMPGVEVHATVVDDLLTGRRLADAPAGAVAAGLLVLSLLVALAMAFCRKTGQGALVLPAGPALAVGGAFAAYPCGWWWPLVAGALAALLAGVGMMVLNYAEEGRQKAFIKNAFRHYLGEDVIDKMLENPSLLKLGGEKRELTAFFSDIEKFSSFSERLSPEDLTSLLNDYLSRMSDIIQEEGGYLDKYIGDAIVAFWNAPVAEPDHAARACRAAVRCQRMIAENRAAWKARYGAELKARIGVNTGMAVVGNMGSRARFNYTMFGDDVNLASRLEGANKAFGTYIMVAESTRKAAGGGFAARELGRLRVVGRSAPVAVYELSTAADGAAPAFWRDFEAATALFRGGGFAAAAELFAQWPEDGASRSYAAACAKFAAHPPENWEGVWNLTEK